jgi:hypothetical protein
MSVESAPSDPGLPPAPPAGGTPAGTTGPIAEKDRQLAVMMHLSALVGYLIPLANFLIPLVIWLVKKDESQDIDAVGREVLNFNLSMLIYFVGTLVLTLILIGIPLMFALWIFGVVVTIIAAVRANDGWRYRYPMTIRFF